MLRIARCVGIVGLVLAACGARALAQDAEIPRALEDWRGWVLAGDDARRCPWLASAGATLGGAESRVCAWPGRLTLDLGATGGRFEQRWRVFADAWVPLPGSADPWPAEVTVDGRPAAIVARDGVPYARLAAGEYTLAGRFGWAQRPESLAVPSATGLIALTIDGRAIAAPTRSDGALFLGARQGPRADERFDVQVYRLLIDRLPQQLVTRLTLRATGASREVVLGPVLPDGFRPTALESPLPARVEPDGSLRIQLRPGTFTVDLTARAIGTPDTLSRPKAGSGWPAEEVWSFAADDRLRVVAMEGAIGIDPAEANVPPEWRNFPAWRVLPDTVLTIAERTRGLASADENRLSLTRGLWLDFDRGGFTAVDDITGSMRAGWRLDVAAPYRLGSAESNGVPLLVTEGTETSLSGVELRSPELILNAVSRIEPAGGALAATGWTARFDNVSGMLHLPPGHRLIAALGVDAAPGAWLEQWGLWSLFGVVIVAVFAGWIGGRLCGALAFVALALTYQEWPGVIWLWANVLAAIAIARATPAGRLQRFAAIYRTVSFAVLALVLVPFMWGQLQLALHPQLDAGYGPTWTPAAMPVAAPPPPEMQQDMARADAPAQMDDGIVASEAESDRITVTANRKANATGESPYGSIDLASRYLPGTVVQAGPGLPSWQYRSYEYAWSGPVEPTQTTRFVIADPLLLGLWRVTGIVLLATLFAWLLSSANPGTTSPAGAGAGGERGAGRTSGRWRLPGFARSASLAGALLATALAVAMTLAPDAARAQSPAGGGAFPDQNLLNELKSRLTRTPDCAPTCAEVLAARVVLEGDRLELTIEASALAPLAVPVPTDPDGWILDSVSVKGTPTAALRRRGDESLWIAIAPGVQTIRVAGRVSEADSVQLVFPFAPRRVAVSATGWDVAGLSNGRLPGGALEFTRRREATASRLDAAVEFPPFVRVIRRFDIGVENAIATRVERIAPARSAFSVSVPLVAGESVLTDTVDVRDGRAAVAAFAAGQALAGWNSSLPRVESLELTAAGADASYVEVWEFTVHPQWRPAFTGIPATLPQALDAGQWIFEFYPRPDETLTAAFARTTPVVGSSLAIDGVERVVTPGKRATDATLNVRYRATQGGRHAVTLAPDARVIALSVDGQPLALRPENGELSLPILPGEHTISVSTTRAEGVGTLTRPAPLDLGVPASNVTTTLALSPDRWALLSFGPGVGPAVLYWSQLVAFLLTAWFLGRSDRSPLRVHEWVLLGVGLSTLSWGVLALVALWLFAMKWRATWRGEVHALTFNVVQVALAALTVIAVFALLFSGIRDGLLSSPDMGVIGPGSGGNRFTWFLDRSGGALPQPLVLSVPLWVFKVLVFAWAVWAAFAVLRWLRYSWEAWKCDGYWRSNEPASPKPEPPPASSWGRS